MSPEQQRIAIAEILGLRAKGDPLNDLNAMHEAEKVLPDGENGPYGKYCIVLNSIACRIQCGNRTGFCGYTLSATAPQRAEAFLRTLGKWVD